MRLFESLSNHISRVEAELDKLIDPFSMDRVSENRYVPLRYALER